MRVRQDRWGLLGSKGVVPIGLTLTLVTCSQLPSRWPHGDSPVLDQDERYTRGILDLEHLGLRVHSEKPSQKTTEFVTVL